MGGGAEPKSRPSRLAFHHRQCPHETETFVSKDSCLTEYYFGEIGLLQQGRCTAGVRASFATSCEVAVLDQQEFHTLPAESEATRNTI